MVDSVRRTEEYGLRADGAFDQALGKIQLPPKFRLGDLIELRMGKGVIADFVAFGVLAFENFGMLIRGFADDEKHAGGLLVLEDVENLGSPARIGAIVEREHDLFVFRAAYLVDVVGKRVFLIGLVGEEIRRNVVDETSAAGFWHIREMPNISVAFEGQIRPGRNISDFLTSG